MTEYHMMNNKRFVLTLNENKLVQLWKLDDLKLVKEFPGQAFSDVRQHLSTE